MSLSDPDREDTTIYKVVFNHEEQYSIWPADRENPPGWKDAGKTGTKAECLAYIKEVWTDMRPMSLRNLMEEARNESPPPPSDPTPSEGSSILEFLCKGTHPVEVALRPEKSAEAFRQAIDRGYVHIKFTDTTGGGTELGVRVTQEASDLSKGNFDLGSGSVRIVGNLTLEYVKVSCVADIDLKSFQGSGHLQKIESAS